MNYHLLKKEVAGLKLILWLVAAICAIDCIYIVTTGFPDILTEAQRASAAKEDLEDVIANVMIFGMLIGVYLLGQEREHGTIPFLDGLPVGRTKLFLYKFLAANCVLAILVAGLLAFDGYFEWLASDSLSPELRWQKPLALGGVMMLLGFAVVGVSTLVSFSRKWFPLLAGLIIWTIVLIRSSDSWLSSWLDSPTLVRWAIDGSRLSLPVQPVVGHFIIGAVGWLAAWIGFQHRDGFWSRQVEWVSQWRLASWLVAFSQLTAAVVWLIAILAMSDGSETDTVESLAADNSHSSMSTDKPAGLVGFDRERTTYYEVVFRESQRDSVEHFVGWLDDLHEQVRTLLQDPPAPAGKIVLDTASPVMSHAAAQTNWTKIRLPLVRMKDDLDLCRTVRHETAHVYIEQLSGGRATDRFNEMRMLHEGLASLAELADNFEEVNEPRLVKERWACAVDSRGRVPFHILCDDERLTALRDPDIVYPLGFIVAQAMIEAGGPTLPRRFLEALKVTSIPPGAKPLEVWRILLQKCDTSIDRVMAEYETQLDKLAEREHDFLEALPRPTAEVRVEASQIVIQVTPKTSSESGEPICCFERDRMITKLPEAIPMTGAGEFRLARSSIAGNKIRLLVGWHSSQSEGPIYEPWKEFELKP